jgi:hypothetical protein
MNGELMRRNWGYCKGFSYLGYLLALPGRVEPGRKVFCAVRQNIS